MQLQRQSYGYSKHKVERDKLIRIEFWCSWQMFKSTFFPTDNGAPGD